MINIRPIPLSVDYKNLLFQIFYVLAAALLVFFFSPTASVQGVDDVTGTIMAPIGNLRSRPTLDSSVIYKLKRGDTVTFLKRKNDWYIVKLQDGLAGWAYQSLFFDQGSPPEINNAFLEKEETLTENRATLRVNVGRVRERPSRNAEIMHALKNGETASVITTQDEWYLVELGDGRLGWAHQGLFFESPREQVAETPVMKEPQGRVPETNAFIQIQEKSPKTYIIKEIEYIMTPEGKEMVNFQLSGNYPPKTFSIAGGQPKVICDFFHAQLGGGIERQLKVDGDLIKQIRIGIHKGSKPKIRVVVDLVEHDEVEIRPVFFENDNLYTLIVEKVE